MSNGHGQMTGDGAFETGGAIVHAASGVDNHTIARAFPEAIGVPAVVLVCWIPAFAFASLVRAVSERTSVPEQSSRQQELDGR